MNSATAVLNLRSTAMFRYKSGIKVAYNRQGYIYFASLLYKDLPEETRAEMDKLINKSAGRFAPALKEFVTKDETAEFICQKHHITRSTLYRIVRRYYENFKI